MDWAQANKDKIKQKSTETVGELDHPDSQVINLKNASHAVRDLWWVGDDYLKYPNQYINENQRLATFHIMEMLGWTFNKKNNIWFKEPHKLRDGTFPNLKKFEKTNRSISKQTIDKIRELHQEGKKNWEIARECGVHSSTAYRYCHPDPNYKKNKYIPKKKRNDSVK